ncbi:hypothetical protein TNCV_3461951 [Trichonephila clavipes]|nr:hypothetical protein TNCV_3461951 [Trichonephila clavipes]
MQGVWHDEWEQLDMDAARISKAKRRKRVTRDMSTLKNSMLELAAKFDDNYNTGSIKSFMFGLNKTEIKTMTDILSRYKFRDSHVSRKKKPPSLQEALDLLQNLPSESNDALTDDSSDEDVPTNYLLKFSLNS